MSAADPQPTGRRFRTHKWRLTGGSTAFRRWRWRCDECGLTVWKTADAHHPLGLKCRVTS